MGLVNRIHDLASQFIDDLAAVDPVSAPMMGVPGHGERFIDCSP